MLYTVDPNADEPIMLINKHIGFDEQDGYGIMGDLFQNELLQLDGLGKKRIQVWINSPGGAVNDGYNIYNAILKSKTPVDTYCMGMAASIAGVIFQAGRKRIMADYGILMYHNPFVANGATGDAKKMLDSMKESLITMICARSGMGRDDAAYMMDRTTFIEALEAKEKGLCDEVESSTDINMKYVRKPEPQNMVHYFEACGIVLNKICDTNTNSKTHMAMADNKLLKLATYLGLNLEANEDSILDSIKSVNDKAYQTGVQMVALNRKMEDAEKKHKDELDKLKADMDEMADKLKAKQKEYEDCKSKLDGMTKEKEDAENKAKEEKAMNMVKGYAAQGRIKDDAAVINKWVGLAKNDFEGTEALIKDIPLNKEAVKIPPAANKLGEGEVPTTAMGLQAKVMANIKNKKA